MSADASLSTGAWRTQNALAVAGSNGLAMRYAHIFMRAEERMRRRRGTSIVTIFAALIIVLCSSSMCSSSAHAASSGPAKSGAGAHKGGYARQNTTPAGAKRMSGALAPPRNNAPAVRGGNNPSKRYVGPKYFAGGAFPKLMGDIAGGARIPAGVGYWLHPMGLGAAMGANNLPAVLSKFTTKYYAYETDLLAWTDGSNPTQTNTPGVWGDFLNAAAGGWKCAAFCAWAKSGDMANPSSAIPKYKALFDKVRAWGCQQCWIFWSPPSEPQYNSTVLRNKTWATIAKAVGATGIAVDHPGDRTDSTEVSFAALKWAKENGLGAAWVFNGSSSGAQVAAMMARIKQNVGDLTFYASDNFSSQGAGWSHTAAELRAMGAK